MTDDAAFVAAVKAALKFGNEAAAWWAARRTPRR